ncbi:MAG: PQQ-binding-like beta-propeller repeat protein, partial [Acidobacteria bacterium]|nr:PQQ-binding-like beta-propeller repeat protein [Acidobacteriota bacterium]
MFQGIVVKLNMLILKFCLLNVFLVVIISIYYSYPFRVFGQNDIDLRLPIRICKKFFMSNISEFPVASDNANVFVPYLNGNLDSIDMNKGDKVWQSELGGRIISAPILDKKDRQNLYIATTPFDVGGLYTPPNIQKVPHTLFLRSINKTTGLTNWLVTVGEVSQVDKLFLYEFQDKIIVISKNGLISAFDKKNGQSIWRISLDNTLTSTPFFSEDKIT